MNTKKKTIIFISICALLTGIALAFGVSFFANPDRSRDLSELTPVKPSWTAEMVILYEKDSFNNPQYEREESGEYFTLKFHAIREADGGIFWAHEYRFHKSTGKLHNFLYWSWVPDSHCSHTFELYNDIIEKYGYEEYKYDHLQSYNGMLGGEKYHVGVEVVDAYLGITDDSRIMIQFFPEWTD
jgi:hypothetical protein